MKIITKKMIKRKISEECWSLDLSLVEWLNEHLEVFKKEATQIVDLEYNKYTYKKKIYTQLQIIDRLIEITSILKNIDYGDCDGHEVDVLKDEMYDLLKLIHWNLWW